MQHFILHFNDLFWPREWAFPLLKLLEVLCLRGEGEFFFSLFLAHVDPMEFSQQNSFSICLNTLPVGPTEK